MSTELSVAMNEDLDFNQADTTQYLTFLLAGEEYGVDVLRVQEIKGWDSVTPIPNTPEFVKGVINIRGSIVPIVDLRIRFDLGNCEYTPTTVMIVLKVQGMEHERTLGIVVDAVSDVFVVNNSEIKPAPDFGSVVETEFVKGLVTMSDKMVILLEIDRLVNEGIMTRILKAQE